MFTALLFSLLLGGVDLEAYPTQPLEHQDQYESVVTLKLVQVFVTDTEGNPVLDLKKSDFELYEDGTLKTITDFERHSLDDEATEVSLAATPALPSEMNRKFFIFLDIFGNDMSGMIRARKAALHFIDTQLRPDDEVAVITYQHMSGFNVKRYLTKDHEKIRKAVKRARELPPGGDRYESGLLTEQVRAERAAGLEEDSWALGKIDRPLFVAGLNRLARNSQDFTDEVTEVGKALRYIPGQKNIILFSGGRFHKAEDMAREFAASSSPVFAVNTMNSAVPENALGHPLPPSPLKTLSDVSGGEYFENAEDVETIAENIQNLTGNYYVLGYYVDEHWDGSFHKIEVKVNRDGCRVHHQEGYYNPTPFSELTDTEKELHLIDLASGDSPVLQSPIRLPLLPVMYPFQTRSYLVLLTELTSDELIKYFSDRTDVVNVVFDEEGEVVDSTRGEVDLSAIGEKNLFHYSVHSLPPGRYTCRFVLRNTESGKGAVAQASVEIPAWQDTRLRLYPPLFLMPDRSAEYIKYTKRLRKIETDRLPSLNEIFPFVSNSHSPLVQGVDAGVSRILAVVRYSVQGIEAPAVLVSAQLVQAATGDVQHLGTRVLSAKEDSGTVVMLLEIKFSGLRPGDYAIKITLEEENTGLEARTSQEIQIR